MAEETDTALESTDPREVCRLSFLRVQNLPKFKKGQSVWYLNGPFWYEAVIDRRLPGNVYWASLVGVPRYEGRVIVTSATCGGAVDEGDIR